MGVFDKSETIGRWAGILPAVGVDIRADGRHAPCPICSGGDEKSDRFRFDDKDGRGTWICSHCGAGDGFRLVEKVCNVDFVGAIDLVKQVIGHVDRHPIPKEPVMTIEKMREIYAKTVPATENNLVGLYLKNRGLSVIPNVLRYHPKCWEPETKKEQHAMMAVVSVEDSKAVTMHRIFLNTEGQKLEIEKPKKLLPVANGSITGGAVRLFEVGENGVLGIAEGIETAIAAHQDVGIPVWSTISAHGMATFKPPKGIKRIEIFSDNDKNYAGQRAAYTLANRMEIKGISANVSVPVFVNTDWLDMLNNKSKK